MNREKRKIIYSYANRISSAKKFSCDKFKVEIEGENYFYVEPTPGYMFEVEACADCFVAGRLVICTRDKGLMMMQILNGKRTEWQRYEWQIQQVKI